MKKLSVLILLTILPILGFAQTILLQLKNNNLNISDR